MKTDVFVGFDSEGNEIEWNQFKLKGPEHDFIYMIQINLSLNHPNILRVFDAWVSEHTAVYITERCTNTLSEE